MCQIRCHLTRSASLAATWFLVIDHVMNILEDQKQSVAVTRLFHHVVKVTMLAMAFEDHGARRDIHTGRHGVLFCRFILSFFSGKKTANMTTPTWSWARVETSVPLRHPEFPTPYGKVLAWTEFTRTDTLLLERVFQGKHDVDQFDVDLWVMNVTLNTDDVELQCSHRYEISRPGQHLWNLVPQI